MRKRIPKKTSSPWAPYLKMREGSSPTTRFDMAMIMTWPAARSALSAPAVQNDLPGKALPGRLAHVLGRSRRTATPRRGRKAL
jgi:hypothetical protein